MRRVENSKIGCLRDVSIEDHRNLLTTQVLVSYATL
jgi:hypothetical protein